MLNQLVGIAAMAGAVGEVSRIRPFLNLQPCSSYVINLFTPDLSTLAMSEISTLVLLGQSILLSLLVASPSLEASSHSASFQE